MNGNERYLTESLVAKATQCLNQYGDGTLPAVPAEKERPDVIIPWETMEMYTSMSKSIERLTDMINRMMQEK